MALAADQIALALAEIGSLAERRIALLTDPALSQLPAFLTPQPGLNSGFMLAQIAAAALASENQHLAHPAGIDSRPTSANQEDHVSMATYAARRLLEMTENAAHIVAIELLAAAQGIELRRPLESSAPLEARSRERAQPRRVPAPTIARSPARSARSPVRSCGGPSPVPTLEARSAPSVVQISGLRRCAARGGPGRTISLQGGRARGIAQSGSAGALQRLGLGNSQA